MTDEERAETLARIRADRLARDGQPADDPDLARRDAEASNLQAGIGRLYALSLHQPWASCVAIGAKRAETRPKRTHHRGLLAIHAAKHEDAATRAAEDRIRGALSSCGYALPDALPRGAVVAVVRVVACSQMDDATMQAVGPLERELGDWRPGRWSWWIAFARSLAEPLPVRGRQGLWRLSEDETREVLARAWRLS